MLMQAALKTNTKKTYSSAQNRFINFCELYHFSIMPVSENTLLLYISYLFEQGLSGSSIRVYLSAVRSMHVFAGHAYPTDLPRVKLALKGAIRETPKPIQKFPITIKILKQILPLVQHRFDKYLMRSVMTLAFFGCFRLGELCLADGPTFSPSKNLCVGDIVLDEIDLCMTVHLKQSKTDVHNRGVSVFVGCSRDSSCCAYCTMKSYLKFRKTLPEFQGTSPLFIVPGGGVLTKQYMISVTRLLLSISGHDPSLFSGHSFRAGAATTAGDGRFREWELKMLGRWASPAYNLYLRNPKVTASSAQRLVSVV
jgi:site-specific recombinase XerD